MTEIIVRPILFIKGIFFCAIDNHNKKSGRSFQIIYKSKNPNIVRDFMIEKGIIER